MLGRGERGEVGRCAVRFVIARTRFGLLRFRAGCGFVRKQKGLLVMGLVGGLLKEAFWDVSRMGWERGKTKLNVMIG